jgi:hypothetical protein
MLNSSGTYYDTLQTSLGCDSILSLIFTVNPVPTTNLSPVAVCQNTLPYNFRGKILNSSGTYYDTLQTSLGCDSILSLVFTVNPTYIKYDTAETCQGNSYFYQGKNYAITGIYRDTLSTINGCDSIFELNLTVNPIFFPTAAAICQGDSYDFNGKTLTIADLYYDTLQTIFGCDSVIELTLTVNSVYFTQIADSVGVGDTYNFNGKLLTADGVYYDTLQTIFGCDSIVKLTLTIIGVGVVETHCNASLPRIYPNPTTGKLRITNYELRENTVIELYDIYGKNLSPLTFYLSPNQIDLSHLANGMYFLKVDGKMMKVIKK